MTIASRFGNATGVWIDPGELRFSRERSVLITRLDVQQLRALSAGSTTE